MSLAREILPTVFTTLIPASPSVSIMSDDEEYYEFEEDFMYEDLVPDMVVRTNPNLTHTVASAHALHFYSI